MLLRCSGGSGIPEMTPSPHLMSRSEVFFVDNLGCQDQEHVIFTGEYSLALKLLIIVHLIVHHLFTNMRARVVAHKDYISITTARAFFTLILDVI